MLSLSLSATKEFFLSLKSFHGVSKNVKGCLKFEGCFMEVSGMFQKVYRVFTYSFKGVSTKFQECFKGVPGKFQGSIKGVSRVF